MNQPFSPFLIDVLRRIPAPRFNPLKVRAATFAIRTTFTSLLALYLALALQLEDPHWAAMTVWIVAQPTRGMALSKGYFRFLGTLAGAFMAILLIALFDQAPVLFLGSFAAWIALCTAVATLLRNFKAYGAVLAGYTCGIIALTVYDQPDRVFDVAVARVTCIALGIVLEAVVSAILVRSAPQPALLTRLRHTCSDVAAFIHEAVTGNETGKGKAPRTLGDIISLDTAISYAAAEDRIIRRRAGALRHIIVSIMTAVASAQALRGHLSRHGTKERARVDLEHAAEILEQVTPENGTEAAGRMEALHAAIRPEKNRFIDPEDFFVAARLSDAIGALVSALRATESFFSGVATDGQGSLSIHRDYDAARINALRAFIAVICAGSFWFASAWSNGQGFTRIVAVVCALYATRDNPVIGSRAFFRGSLVAAIVAGFYHLFVLPAIDGFPLLAMVLVPPLVIAGILMLQPRTAGIAAAFNIFFISLLGIANSSRLAFDDFLNAVLALVFGVGISMIVFMVVFPINPVKRRFGIQRATLRDISQLASLGNRVTEDVWCSRMADRMALLAAASPPGDTLKLMNRTLAAVEIGVQTIRLRDTARVPGLPAAHRMIIGQSLAAIEHIAHLGIIARLDRIVHLDMVSLFGRFLRRNNVATDSIRLRDTLMDNATRMKNLARIAAGTEITGEYNQLLHAIAAQQEIAEILNLHYLDPEWQKRLSPLQSTDQEAPA